MLRDRSSGASWGAGIVGSAPAAARTSLGRGFRNLRAARRTARPTLFGLGVSAGAAADDGVCGAGFMRTRIHAAEKMAHDRLRCHCRCVLFLLVSRHGNPEPYGSADRTTRSESSEG